MVHNGKWRSVHSWEVNSVTVVKRLLVEAFFWFYKLLFFTAELEISFFLPFFFFCCEFCYTSLLKSAGDFLLDVVRGYETVKGQLGSWLRN